MSLSEFGERLKINLIKKWNQFENEKLEEDFPFYTMIEFSNKVPIAMEYKNIKLLGGQVLHSYFGPSHGSKSWHTWRLEQVSRKWTPEEQDLWIIAGCKGVRVMLKECLEVFGEVLAKERQKGKDIILDSYIPADGTYIFVTGKGIWKSL